MRRRRFIALALGFAALPPSLEAAEKRRSGGESFIQFPTLTAGLTRPDRSRGVLAIEAGLDVPDPALRARAVGLEPRLLDAYASFLDTYAPSISPGTPPDPGLIGAQLQRATDRVLGRPGARFLFGSIIVN